MSVVGGNGQDFWTVTPRQIQNVFDGHSKRLTREHNGRAWQAWHSAYLGAYPPAKPKDFQPLAKLQISDKPKKHEPQDWQRTFDAFSAWAQSAKR